MAPLKHFISMLSNCLHCCFYVRLHTKLTPTSKTSEL